MGVQILATGSYAPEQVVDNEDLAQLGYDADWIVKRTGIRQRRRAADEHAASDLGAEAARRCLAAASVDVDDVDLIIVATMSPDTLTPSTGCHIQRLLGAKAPAMDVSAACAGFMFALTTAAQFVKTGASRRALVVGTDVMSRIVHPEDKKIFPLFGDGAGAVLVGPGEPSQGLLSATLGSEGEGADLLCQAAGGSRQPVTAQLIEERKNYLQMDGRQVFRWAVRLLEDSVADVLNHAGLTANELDLVVLHQANVRIIDAAVDSLGIDRDKVVVNLDLFGNTSAASIPLALDEASAAGRVQPGGRILMSGFGAGLCWGTAIMSW